MQESLLDNLHYLNLILKSRQLGVTTFVDILALDTVLFYPNITAEIIAHKRDDAEKIFNRIVKPAWDDLPEWLKGAYEVDMDTRNALKFSHGSSIRVSTSARSGTLQFLHISELGTMSVKYPEKAKEVITGSLNAIEKGQLVFIESTAKGRDGIFYEMCMQALKREQEKRKLTMMDYRLHFFPWWKEKEYRLEEEVVIPKNLAEYFEYLENRGIKLDPPQKWWYVKKYEVLGDEMRSEYPSYPEEAFEVSIEGAYFSKQMAYLRRNKHLTRVPWDPRIDVDTWWDIGYDDYTAIIFTQSVGKELRLIDYYENSQEDIVHYINYLRSLPYKYGKHTLPHDAESKSIQTGKSTKQLALEAGLFPIFIAPRPKNKQAAIEQARELLPRVYIDEVKCSRLIACLDNYRKEWDEKLGQWKPRPRHDEFSHGADAFQVLASMYQISQPPIEIYETLEVPNPYKIF